MNKKNNKYEDYLIISQKNHSPPYEWSEGLFQRFKPVSGEFKIGDNFEGNMECVNNQTGRNYHANPCGYWEFTTPQFNPGTNHKNINNNGHLFPVKNGVMTTPNNKVVFGYTRIGEEYRNR